MSVNGGIESYATCTTCGKPASPHPYRHPITLMAAGVAKPRSESAGVWLVAGQAWGNDGPGEVVPYVCELDAHRASNRNEMTRVWFVPYGKDLREVMNER